jgi:ATP-dependent 26S proteasome regulatory subunit
LLTFLNLKEVKKEKKMSLNRCHVLLVTIAAIASVASCRGPTLSPPSGDSNGDVQPMELLHVYGCEGSSNPRRETFGCRPDGTSRLTIRGRQFLGFGNSVMLQESMDMSVGRKRGGSPLKVTFDCAQLRSSTLLPAQLLTCTIPSKEEISKASGLGDISEADAGQQLRGTIWFDVKVSSGFGKTVAILRRSVQIKFGGASEHNGDTLPSEGAIPDDTSESLDALRKNDWQSLGIGGLGKPIQELFRRAFSTRTSVSAAISGAIGVPHVKGIILHGPPGTGKTLLARTVAKLLNAKNVQVVNGPEVMSKFVGDSEKNLRALFAPAEEDFARNGQASGLHVIIFDEVDAILRPRGEGDDSAARAVYDGVTTQMLAAMDGVHTRSNLLIIGLTNRLDALDKALLRPGRFEVQIRVPLPDEEGRLQIFAVHTKSLKAHRYLSPKVNFHKLAADTSSFSGADISGVVRSAISFALERYQNETIAAKDIPQGDFTQKEESPTAEEVTPCPSDSMEEHEGGNCLSSPRNHGAPTFLVEERDLVEGIREILATKGAASNMAPYLRNGVVLAGSASHRTVLTRLVELMDLLRKSNLRQITVGLYGPPGSGSTALAALAARLSHASYTQMVTINSLDGLSVTEKIRRLSYAFDTAAHVPSSLIVLDKLEDILEMNMGRRPHDRLATELIQMIQRDDVATGRASDKEAKRLVLVVTSRKDLASHFGPIAFEATLSLDGSTSFSTEQLLCAYGVARTQRSAKKIAQNLPAGLPLKRLVFLVEASSISLPTSAEDGSETEKRSDARHSRATRPVVGDVSEALFVKDIDQTTTSLCGDEEEANDDALRRRDFLTTARDFGHGPSSATSRRGNLDL